MRSSIELQSSLICLAALVLAGCGAASMDTPPALRNIHDTCQELDMANAGLAVLEFSSARENGHELAAACSAASRWCESQTAPGCAECRQAVVEQVYGRVCGTAEWQARPSSIAGTCDGLQSGEAAFYFVMILMGASEGQTLESECAVAAGSCSEATTNCPACMRTLVAQVFGQECPAPEASP